MVDRAKAMVDGRFRAAVITRRCWCDRNTNSRATDPQDAIHAKLWDTETTGGFSGPDQYRAMQGTCLTPWRATWAEVLADVETQVTRRLEAIAKHGLTGQ